MTATEQKLKAVLIGCGGMGANQARILARMDEFDLTAVCDAGREQADKAAGETGAQAYTDVATMLAEQRPDTVSICTPNNSHAPLTIQAAEFGVKGVYCEKPMAVNMAEARAMVAACKDTDTVLVVNHQRRLGPDLTTMKRLIDEGAIGDVYLVRAQCAGDILSDGTHAVDSVMWLTGDQPAEWVLAQIHRAEGAATATAEQTGALGRQKDVAPGFRYGHVVETGGIAVVQLTSGIRVEFATGDMREKHRVYQDYEVFGTKGRLWRTGDRGQNLFIQDGQPGPLVSGIDEWTAKPMPVAAGEQGDWRAVELPEKKDHGIVDGYRRFADTIWHGTPHPMAGEIALRGFEIVMGIYESARLHRKLVFPLEQDAFPLVLMVEAGLFM